jgi:hypothetical protein
VGLFTLTQATLGVGLLAMACFLGILARISQAATTQRMSAGQPPPQPQSPRRDAMRDEADDKARAYGVSAR